MLTIHDKQRVADLRIIWQGGAVTEISMPMTRTGEHPRATREATVALVRRLAAHYDDKTIAQISSKQHQRTATGLAWTKTRVRSLRVSKGIPAHIPPEAGNVGGGSDDGPCSPSRRQPPNSASASTPSSGGCATDSSPASSSPPPRPGGSASTRPSATRSHPRPRPAGYRWTRPPPPSASPGRPCVAQGPPRRAQRRPSQPRATPGPSYPGQTGSSWTARHTQ